MSNLLAADDWLGQLAAMDWKRDFRSDTDGAHQGWFAVLAQAHSSTEGIAHGLGAVLSLESWFNGGFLEAEQDTDIVASRILAWALAAPMLAEVLRPELAVRMHEAVDQQGRWLAAQRLKGVKAVRPLAALVAGDLAFPVTGGGRRWWSGALTSLAREIPRLVRPDGTPVPLARGRWVSLLEAWEVARACCVREGVGLPSVLEASTRRAAAYLAAMGEGRWEEGEWGRTYFQGGGWRRNGEGDGLASSPAWDLHAFRDGGEVVAYGHYQKRAMRLRLSASDGRWAGRLHGLSWALEGLSILREPAWRGGSGGWKAGEVLSARVEGRRVRIVMEPKTWRGTLGRRVVEVEGARLRVTDHARRGRSGFSHWWHFGEGWGDWRESSGRWLASLGDHTIEVKPAPDLDWRIEQHAGEGVALVGEGVLEAGQPLPMSIELRG